MRNISAGLAVVIASILSLSLLTRAAEADPGAADEKAVAAAKVGTDGPALLEYLRKRAAARKAGDKIKDLVRQLGDKSFDVREAATAALLKLDGAARPFLEPARNDPDVEIARRATDLLALIKNSETVNVDGAVTRLVGLRKPEGAAEVLVHYLPAAPTEMIAADVLESLSRVAVHKGEPDRFLVGLLKDREQAQRIVAAEALCRGGAAGAFPAIRELMKDDDIEVRIRAGTALVNAGDKAPLAPMIELLVQLPRVKAWAVEDLLLRVADGKGPPTTAATDDAGNKARRDGWAAWWTREGEKLKLEPTPRPLGKALVILLPQGGGEAGGTVREVDIAGRTLWEIKDAGFPLDAQLLPGDRVLIAERGNRRVAERDFTGKVVWKHDVQEGPLAAQRLANGNTFIVTERRLFEVDKDNKELYTYSSRPVRDDDDDEVLLFRKAQKMANGDIVYVTGDQKVVRLDADRKEKSRVAIDPNTKGVRTNGGRIDVLANGNVLVPLMDDNKVVEYDPKGNAVWEAKVEQPVNAVRLPNGHTVVTTFNQMRAMELDRAGREVWEYKGEIRVTRAWRR